MRKVTTVINGFKTDRHARCSIVHIGSQLSPDLDFGGPVRVAVNLAREQRARGQRVIIAGAATSGSTGPQEFMGLPAHIFRGWQLPGSRRATLRVSFGLWAFTARVRSAVEVIHIHMGRDLISIVAALIATTGSARVVLQTHGMVEPPRLRIVAVLDRLATRRVFAKAHAVLTLTRSESDYANHLARQQVARSLANGIPISNPPSASQSIPSEDFTILFLGRLHPRKGVVQLARVVTRSNLLDDAALVVAGPDEGDLPALRALIGNTDAAKANYIGAVRGENVHSIMASADLYVLPAPAEPFGMTVLEALNAATPVLLHRTAALASELESEGLAFSFDGTDDHLEEVLRHIIRHRKELREMGRRGHEYVQAKYGIGPVTDLVNSAYLGICDE